MSESRIIAPLFTPRSVALVGASDNNPWCGLVQRVLGQTGFTGPVHLVNRSGKPALGRETVVSCVAIGDPVDAAFVAVPAAALEEALEDMAAAGIRYGVVVTSGFAELGEEGAARQARVFDQAREMGLTLLGPNSLGILNFVAGASMTPIPPPQPFIRGAIGLVSQSGATTSTILDYASRQGIGFTYAVALGNEAQIDLAQVINFLIDDPDTRAIAVYAETIRDGAAFKAASVRALAAAKPIVMLKVGVGALAAELAQAHTGALVGDDKVFDAVCHRHGVIRVRSLEQLVLCADLLAFSGVLDPRGIAALSMSGGACGMIADMAELTGVSFARLEPETLAALRDILPAYGTPNNPLDITGGAMGDATMFSRSIDALAADPGVGMVLCIHDSAPREGDSNPIAERSLAEIGKGLGRAGKTALLLQQTSRSLSDYARASIAEAGVPHVISSMREMMEVIAFGRAWSDRVRRNRATSTPHVPPVTIGVRPIGERQTLDFLNSRGVPVIPATIVGSGDEASAAVVAMDTPVALKILSPDIAHKTEVGGVMLDVRGGDAAAAYAQIVANAEAAKPEARIEGVLVSPMRRRDVELFVGVARDPMWGPVLALGLGGIWVELLADVSLRVLPVAPDDVLEMLGELRSAKLLDGYRGAPPVDRQALARIVSAIGDAALALGPDLVSLEINPLNSGPAGIEALDALAIWS